MLRMKKLAMENEDIAYALMGQAILDEAKRVILSLLRTPKTVRELCMESGLGGSSVRRHLRDLEKAGKVIKSGKNVKAEKKNYRLAELWAKMRILSRRAAVP